MIYVARTHRINLTNIFVAVLIESAGQQVHGPCYYSVTPTGFLDQIPGDFAQTMCEDPITQTRNIDWASNIDRLRAYHTAAGKHLIFGSHHPDQIQYLKTQLTDQSCTVAMNYDTDDYDRLLHNLARDHVRLLQAGRLEASIHDQDLMDTLTATQLVGHYAQEFDRMQLIPRAVSDTFDYQIRVKDLYNKSRMTQHVRDLGFEFSALAESYYDHWLSRQILA